MEMAARGIIELFNINWNSEEKQNNLKRKLYELTSIEDDINTQLKTVESSSSNKKQKREVANWLADVGNVKQEFQNFEADMKKSYWSKFWGARVTQLTNEVEELIRKSRFQGGLVLEVCEIGAEKLLVTNLVGKAFEENLRKVLEWLMQDEVSRIGVYGMGGVGKTTLVIYNLLLERQNIFRNVYWITVAQDCNIHKLQSHIANAIKFNLCGKDEQKIKAAKLSKALDKKQKFVIVLDDLWNQFSLEEVGLPIDCKLIMTTRSLEICRMMSCHKKMKLELLLEEESWNLFIEKFGNYATLPSEVKEIAKFVVRECAGLPLGIVTLAGTMRGVDDMREWRSVLEQLKQSIIELDEMDDKVFKVLNLSYERLRDPALQECFLYCALFPEDWLVSREELIKYLISENIMKDLNNRQAQFDKGHTMLNKLENACLLVGSSQNDYVKMHDLIRDMAINKMKGNPKTMVKAGKGLKEVPNVNEWTNDLVRVSLMKNYIEEVPWSHSSSCPNLSTLLLCDNGNLVFIADSFFFQFCGLKVLNLSKTAIKVLPNSISNLVNLTSLLLRNCFQLRYMPSLATLKTLKELDLLECKRLEMVPGGLELLSNLQYLDMVGTDIKVIPDGLLPNLSHQQYLSLDWSTTVKVKSACLEKVEHLECRFPVPQHFNYHGMPLLSFYRLLIGEFNDDVCKDDSGTRSKLVVYSGCYIGKDGDLVRIPKDLDLLVISECRTLRSLEHAFLPDGAREVRIETCQGLKYLISLSGSSTIFDHVMKLRLDGLDKLRNLISRGGAPPPSFQSVGVFSCLKCLDIWHCQSIRSLLPFELLPNLQNLEEITVGGCKNMKRIIGEGSNSDSSAEFISLPKLRNLELWDLPELKSICSKKMACDSMETISIEFCPKLKRMPRSLIQLGNRQLSPLPSLKKIKTSPRGWWNSVELDHPNAKDVLRPLLIEKRTY